MLHLRRALATRISARRTLLGGLAARRRGRRRALAVGLPPRRAIARGGCARCRPRNIWSCDAVARRAARARRAPTRRAPTRSTSPRSPSTPTWPSCRRRCSADVRALLQLVEHGSSLFRGGAHALHAPVARGAGRDARRLAALVADGAAARLPGAAHARLRRLLARRSHLAAPRLLGPDAARAPVMIERGRDARAATRTLDVRPGRRRHRRRRRDGGARRRRAPGLRVVALEEGAYSPAARLHAARGRDAAAPVPGRRRPHHRRRRDHRAARPRRRRLDGAQHQPVQARAGAGARRLAPRRLARGRAGAALRGRRARSVGGADRGEPRQPQQRAPAARRREARLARRPPARTIASAASARASASSAAPSTPSRTRSRCSSPTAVAAGARVVAECRAERVLVEHGRAVGVQARALDADGRAGATVTVRARACAWRAARSARRRWRCASGLPNPSGASAAALRLASRRGRRRHLRRGHRGLERHPAELGVHREAALRRARGQRRSHLDHHRVRPSDRAGLVAAGLRRGAHEADAALPAHRGAGGHAARSLRRAASPSPRGRPGRRSTRSTRADQRALVHAAWRRAPRSCFAAGARQVVVPFAEPLTLVVAERARAHRGARLSPARSAAHRGAPDGHARARPRRRRARPLARRRRLWVADGSLFPTSLGGPPQLTHLRRGAQGRRPPRRGARVTRALVSLAVAVVASPAAPGCATSSRPTRRIPRRSRRCSREQTPLPALRRRAGARLPRRARRHAVAVRALPRQDRRCASIAAAPSASSSSAAAPRTRRARRSRRHGRSRRAPRRARRRRPARRARAHHLAERALLARHPARARARRRCW